MRRDAAILEDILTSTKKILEFCAGIDLAELVADELRQAAILHHRTIIGKAASRISPQLRERHAGIPWPLIVSLRNRVVHEYFVLDWGLIWKTIQDDLPRLRDQVSSILATESGE